MKKENNEAQRNSNALRFFFEEFLNVLLHGFAVRPVRWVKSRPRAALTIDEELFCNERWHRKKLATIRMLAEVPSDVVDTNRIVHELVSLADLLNSLRTRVLNK